MRIFCSYSICILSFTIQCIITFVLLMSIFWCYSFSFARCLLGCSLRLIDSLQNTHGLIQESHRIMRLKSTFIVLFFAFEDLSKFLMNFLPESFIIEEFISKLTTFLIIEA